MRDGEKKQVSILSFTPNGRKISGQVAAALKNRGYRVEEAVKSKKEADSIKVSLTQWTKERFKKKDVLIYIGATGIAVRGIAPFVASKCTDPAVLVIDERGTYCISLLSGHLGGANEMSLNIQQDLGIQAIITTGTDRNRKWAVDVFAARNHLWISRMDLAKEVSAKILRGEGIKILLEEGGEAEGFEEIEEIRLIKEDEPEKDKLKKDELKEDKLKEDKWKEDKPKEDKPKEDKSKEDKSKENKLKEDKWTKEDINMFQKEVPDVYIGTKNPYEEQEVLCLVPKALVVGVGCRKGTACDKIQKAVERAMETKNLWHTAVRKLTSITDKAKEPGILAYCQKQDLDWETYTAAQLQAVEGRFTESAFVEKTVGVGSVCERSAVLGLGEEGRGDGSLILRKQAEDGVTVAVAKGSWRVRFERE